MKKRFHKLALFIGAASFAGAGLIVACSSSNDAPVPTPAIDGSKADGGGNNPDTSPPQTPDSGGDAGGDADCTKDPKLRDFTSGFRCAFADGGGVGKDCTKEETCCNPNDKVGTAFQPSYCASTPSKGDVTPNANCRTGAPLAGSTFDGGTEWECSDKNACAAGQVCCAIQDPAKLPKTVNVGATLATDKNHPPACGVQRLFNEGGSRCKASCASPEVKLCSLSDMNCGAATCTPIVTVPGGTNLGYCK